MPFSAGCSLSQVSQQSVPTSYNWARDRRSPVYYLNIEFQVHFSFRKVEKDIWYSVMDSMWSANSIEDSSPAEGWSTAAAMVCVWMDWVSIQDPDAAAEVGSVSQPSPPFCVLLATLQGPSQIVAPSWSLYWPLWGRCKLPFLEVFIAFGWHFLMARLSFVRFSPSPLVRHLLEDTGRVLLCIWCREEVVSSLKWKQPRVHDMLRVTFQRTCLGPHQWLPGSTFYSDLKVCFKNEVVFTVLLGHLLLLRVD